MVQLIKFTKKYTFKLVFHVSSTVFYNERRYSSIAPVLAMNSRLFHTFTPWASQILPKDRILTSSYGNLASYTGWTSRSFSTINNSLCNLNRSRKSSVVRSPDVISQAQTALLEYLQSTSSFEYNDAEYMSKNTPNYIDKILDEVIGNDSADVSDVSHLVTRFLSYHPPNEFELFFESIGLQSMEINSFIPRDLIFLKDVKELLDNYTILWTYGIDKHKIGRIYKEATCIFKYENGILMSKLKNYENLGLGTKSVMKIVVSNPKFLIGNVNGEFVKVLEELDGVGINRDKIGEFVSENCSYDWCTMTKVLQSLLEMGFTKKELGTLIIEHPDFIFDASGDTIISLTEFLLKVGVTKNEIFNFIKSFPCVRVNKFMENLQKGLLFLVELEMIPEDTNMILCSHYEFLGTKTLKKASTVASLLQISTKRLHEIVKEDPDQLKMFVIGRRLIPLSSMRDLYKSHTKTMEFLLSLGFVKDSKEMQKALKNIHRKGDELQGQYDTMVKCGLDPSDVCNIIKSAPNVLNVKKDVMEKRISFLTKEMGYPLSALVNFPKYLTYSSEKVRSRFLMYKWLKARKMAPKLALGSILACSDEKFMNLYINEHPKGPEMWENLKAKTHSKKKGFLLSLGYVEDSKIMQNALKRFRGKGDDLQERYDAMVKCGLDPSDVCKIVKAASNVMGMKVEVIEKKINFLTKEMGYPLTELVNFPKYLVYSLEKVRSRFLMYKWLKARNKVPELTIENILACPDDKFIDSLVKKHPKGPELWETLKAEQHLDMSVLDKKISVLDKIKMLL